MKKRIMIDADLCDGCKNCSIACMQAHQQDTKGSIHGLNLSDPNVESRNEILLDSKGNYRPLFCRHCDQPECVASCMSGALEKDPVSGHVQYDKERCGACFMCVMNCPFGVLKPDQGTRTYVVKCDFCIEDQEEPNCVKSCPKQAIYVKEV